jgi:hypothetical protein
LGLPILQFRNHISLRLSLLLAGSGLLLFFLLTLRGPRLALFPEFDVHNRLPVSVQIHILLNML